MSRRSRSKPLASPHLQNYPLTGSVSVVKVRPMAAFRSSKSLLLPRFLRTHYLIILEGGLFPQAEPLWSRVPRPLPVQIFAQRHPPLRNCVQRHPWPTLGRGWHRSSSMHAQRRPPQNSPQKPSSTNHVPEHQARTPPAPRPPSNPAPHARVFPGRLRGRRPDTNHRPSYHQLRLFPRDPLGRHRRFVARTHHSLNVVCRLGSCVRPTLP